MSRYLLLLICLTLAAVPVLNLPIGPKALTAIAEVYVAPNGTPVGNGTRERPLDLATALSGQNDLIRPGMTVWLRGGTYRGSFTSNLTGTSGSPITVRQFVGERAIIDSADSTEPTLTVNGAWTNYWGFEITNSNPDRVATRPNGVMIFGPRTRFINMVVHDTGVGMGFWTPAIDAEIYGCIIYRNGWQGPPPDRGHGHGIYTQNAEGTKHITDNIIFDQYGYGIHNYAEAGDLKGMVVEGNIVFCNGSSARPDNIDDPNILIGGAKPAERISLIDNCTYYPWSKEATNVWLNYSAKNNRGLVLRGNYLAGGAPLIMSEWFEVVADDNTLIGQGTLAAVRMPVGALPSTYSWDNNTYYTNNSTAASPFIFETAEKSSSYNFADWQKVTGFDRQGRQFRSATAKPSGVKVIIRPNLFEAGRAHLAVYNWDNSSEVEVNLKDFLPNGARYEIRNVYDYFGAPVSSNLYDGKPIRLPMGNTKTGPEFNAFVLTVINSRNLKPRNTRFIN